MMNFRNSGGEISMNNDDLENNYSGGEQPSRMVEENEMQSSEERSDEVKAHDWYLPKRTYDSIKQNENVEIEHHALRQKSPGGNTVLHIAALYGNERCVERVVEIDPTTLLTARNTNGDTPLHVAARAGKISTLEKLLAALCNTNSKQAKEVILGTNKQGNNFFHEALLNGHIDVMRMRMRMRISSQRFKKLVEELVESRNKKHKSVLHLAFEYIVDLADEKGSDDIVDEILTRIIPPNLAIRGPIMHNNPDDRHSVSSNVLNPYRYYMETTAPQYFMNQDMKMARPPPNKRRISPNKRRTWPFLPEQQALSALIVAILKQHKGILRKIVYKKKELIHVKDDIGRNALHYAASIGYLDGVETLLQNCNTCNMERDKDGFFPLHLASACGHTEVVKKLLQNCPNPNEIVDNEGRNIVHIAAIMGQFNVVKYVLQDANDGVKDMINAKDYNGNTPLHLAASHCRPKIVQALTWDKRVDLHCLNNNNQTALDAFEQFKEENNPPFPQRLTWCQLKSAGVQNAKRESDSIEIPSPRKPKAKNTDFYKDRINTLMLVSTLITTVAFAAGFTLPGGTNSSAPGQGMALMLNHAWFKPFIFCTTTSMYGGISVTIILIWAQLGDVTLALLALKVARPLLGVTLATLSVAFLAGVHLAISELSWLATSVLILCVIFILLLLLLYTLLWFPSESSNIIMRYISFYPFQFLTWLFEKDSTEDEMKDSTADERVSLDPYPNSCAVYPSRY